MTNGNGNGNGNGIVRFELNVPQRIALKYPTGLPVEGRYGPQALFTLADERKVYLDEKVAAQVEQLQVRPGEWLEVVKRQKRDGRKTLVEWAISRVGAPQVAIPAALPQENQPTPESQPITPHNIQESTANSQPVTLRGAMEECLCGAVEALLKVRAHAKARGWELNFNEEDVRNVGVSLFIRRMDPKGGAWLPR